MGTKNAELPAYVLYKYIESAHINFSSAPLVLTSNSETFVTKPELSFN